MKTLVMLLMLAATGLALAADYVPPTSEQAFLDDIRNTDKAGIVERFGDPGTIVDIRDQNTGEVIGTVWQYHYLNTSEDGDYYKTTELDFVGDRVVTVVFSNTDEAEDDTLGASLAAGRSETF